jgi:ligand-binding sensor protein
MKLHYLSPSIHQLCSTRLYAFTQAGSNDLAALTACQFTGGCEQQTSGTVTAFFHICAAGVTDPSYFDGQHFTYLLSGDGCTQIDTELFNCRTADSNDISCPEELDGISVNAFTCDITHDCTPSETDCNIEGAGVTVDGNFTNCPTGV